MAEEEIKLTLSDRLNNFFTQNRKTLLIVLLDVLVFFLALVGWFAFVENQQISAIAKIETLVVDFEKFKSEELKNALDSLTEEEKKLLADKENALIESLIPYTDKNNYAGFMAAQQIADIYFKNENFEKALSFYEKINLPSSKYVTGVSLFNAAACADELGQSEKAIELYNKAANCEDFPFKARAFFNIARVQENTNKERAIEGYKKIISEYPNTEWAYLSKTRIIELELK
ncbi:MAG: tetratricopeptide repeat protein [Treponemataceae bacterium]